MKKPTTFGSLIRDRRAAKNATLRDVAERIGVSVAYLFDIERDRRGPLSGDRLIVLADALEIELQDLEKAAAVSRGAFELEAGPTPAHIDVGAELAEAWPGLNERDLQRIKEAIHAGARRARKV